MIKDQSNLVKRFNYSTRICSLKFEIHNGKFIPITISDEMVGHKLGEFVPTRQFVGHTPADKS